ncbi:MAG: CPBP family intramembrane metalloprotease [Sedimentisphaerales bacterium]|nr:CPBP family intramembrane metalloprotease [Sedimentisphaerales bacterium]
MAQETEHGTIRERLLALVETSVVFAVVMLLIKVRMHLPSLAHWQGRVLGRPFIGAAVCLYVFPLLVIKLTRLEASEQSLSRSFGRPYCFLGIRFGWGLILASCLFGLMHYLSPSNPFHLPWAVWVTTSSLVFGLIREKGGSFIASGIAHGLMLLPKVLFAG